MSRRRRSGGTPVSLFAFQDIITCVMGIMLLLTLMMSLQVAAGDGSQTSPEARELMQSMKAEAERLEQAVADTVASVTTQTALLKSGALLDAQILEGSVVRINNEITSAELELQRLELMTAATESDLAATQSELQGRSADIARTNELGAENQQLQQEIRKLQSGQRVIYNAHDSQSQQCWLVELTGPTDIKTALIGQEHSVQTFPNAEALTRWIQAKAGSGDAFMLLIKPSAAAKFDEVTQVLHSQNSAFGFDLLPQDTFVLGQESEGTP